ncbi:hypothetical protein PRIEUP_LOCUS16743 [Pristimantis euphronides]
MRWRYYWDENILFNILLPLENTLGHPPYLDDFHPKVVYLPSNTTSLIQPMDQGVIAIFKKYYLHRTRILMFLGGNLSPQP